MAVAKKSFSAVLVASWKGPNSPGPAGSSRPLMGPDAYRTALMFQVPMPELRNDVRFARLCARLGLVEYWTATEKWQNAILPRYLRQIDSNCTPTF